MIASTSIIALATANPGLLPTEQVTEFNQAFAAAMATGKQSEREKLLVFAGGFLFIQALGGPESDQVLGLLASRNINNKVSSYNKAAQLVLGINVKKMVDLRETKEDIKAARNTLGRVEKLFVELEHRFVSGLIAANIEAEALANLIQNAGGVDGMIKKNAKDGADDEEQAVDLSAMSEAIAQSGIDLGEAPFMAPDPTLSILRVINGRLMIVPLQFAPASVIGSVADYLPNPDESAPQDVRFWGDVAALCGLFDRRDSEVSSRPDIEGAPPLPSLPVVLVETANSMSISATRVAAGMVVRVAGKAELRLRDVSNTHLNGTDTRALMRLAGSGTRANFSATKFAEETRRLTFDPKFEGDKPIAIKFRGMDDFGSSAFTDQWTLRVRAEFAVKAGLDVELVDGRLPAVLTGFASKAQAGKSPVVIKFDKDGMTLALGKKSQAISIPGRFDGVGSVNVSATDFARVVERVVALSAPAFRIGIDPAGAASFKFATSRGEYEVVMPTVFDGGERNPSLFEQVRRPGGVAQGPASTAANEDAQIS